MGYSLILGLQEEGRDPSKHSSVALCSRQSFQKCPLENSPMQVKGLSDVSRRMFFVFVFSPFFVCVYVHMLHRGWRCLHLLLSIFGVRFAQTGSLTKTEALWLATLASKPDCLPVLILKVWSQCLAFSMRAREPTQVSMLVHHLLLNCLQSLLYFLFYTNHHSGFFPLIRVIQNSNQTIKVRK